MTLTISGGHQAWAAGRITQDCWQWLLAEYLGRIEAAAAEPEGLDAVYLTLHGAMPCAGHTARARTSALVHVH